MKVATKQMDQSTSVDFYLDKVVVHQDGETYQMDYTRARPNLIVARGMSGEVTVENGGILVSIKRANPLTSTVVETEGAAPDLLKQLQPVIEHYRPKPVKIVLSGLKMVVYTHDRRFILHVSSIHKDDWMTILDASDGLGSNIEVTIYSDVPHPTIVGRIVERKRADKGPAKREERTTYYLDQKVESLVVEKSTLEGVLGLHYKDEKSASA